MEFMAWYCRGDSPNQDDSLWQLHGPTSCVAEARKASSVRRQQLRTDLTLRLSERCVEGLSLCGPSDAEHHANQCSVAAGHAPNDSPAGQRTCCTPHCDICAVTTSLKPLPWLTKANADSRRLWRSALLVLAMDQVPEI